MLRKLAQSLLRWPVSVLPSNLPVQRLAPLFENPGNPWLLQQVQSNLLTERSSFVAHNVDRNSWSETLSLLGRPGFRLDSTACASFLCWCRNTQALSAGKRVHEFMIQSGLAQSLFLGSLLLQMYDKCGTMDDARKCFVTICQRDVASWNVIIRGLAREGRHLEVLQQFAQMQKEGISPNKSTFMCMLSVCGSIAAITEGKRMHVQIMETEFKSDVVVWTALVNMYGNCGSLTDAEMTFDRMPLRNAVSWTSMISVYVQHGHGKDALIHFGNMLHHGVQPDKVTFVSVLAACSNQALLAEGKEIHAWTLISGVEPDINVGNALISMYVKCANLEDAQRVFGRMQERDVISWTSLITVCAVNGKSNEVLELFDQMQEEGVTPNKITFVNLVTVFANEAALAKGECIHSCIIKRGFELDVVVANALINMYCKCDSLEDARSVFDKMHGQNVVSWSSIITMYAQQEQCEEAFELFYQMQQVGISPNNITFSGILDACSSLAEGKQIHASIQERGCESDVVVGTALIKMYSKCGSLKDARTMFDKICEPDVVTWNAIIAAYTDNEQGKESFQLFDQMQGGGAMPSKATFYCLLAACSSQEFLIEGVRMHARLMCIETNSDVLIATSLVNMYGKCRSPTKAYELFDKMLQRSVASWTAMIAVYAENGQDRKALQLFEQMQSECILPNKITFVIALMACANQAVLVGGKRMHAYIVDSGFVSDVVVGNALISMYGKCGSLKDARGTFDNIVMRNVVSWTGMIAAYVQHGEGMEAMQLYCQMQNQGVLPNRVTFVSILDAYAIQTALFEGKRLHACMLDEFESDIDVGNAMVNMYGKCGCLEYAWRIFSSMAEGDSFLWNAIIGVYAEHGKGKEALQLVERMRLEGFMPDEVTFVNTLVACSHAGLVDEGCCYISYMLQGQDLSPDLYGCIIDLLGRAGLLEVAENLINDMPFQPTIISFMALLGACRYQADVERGKRAAKHLFELDPQNTAPSYVLSQVYTTAGSRENLAKLMGDYM